MRSTDRTDRGTRLLACAILVALSMPPMVFGLVLPTEHSWDPDMPEYSDPDFVWLVTMATACAVALAGLGAAVGFALGKVARVFFVVLLILYGWRLGVLIPHFSE